MNNEHTDFKNCAQLPIRPSPTSGLASHVPPASDNEIAPQIDATVPSLPQNAAMLPMPQTATPQRFFRLNCPLRANRPEQCGTTASCDTWYLVK